MNQQIQTITFTNQIDWTVKYYCLRLFSDYFINGNAFLKKKIKILKEKKSAYFYQSWQTWN